MPSKRCRRCHRRLKTPEAIAVGFGSCCYKKMFGKAIKNAPGRERTDILHRISGKEEIEGQVFLFDTEGEVKNHS